MITVTDIETKTLLDMVEDRTESRAKRVHSNSRTYFDLGDIGGARVFSVRSEMAASSVGGALATTVTALSDLHPSAVVMVGLAFGVDPKKQPIGSVLVSQQIQCYDLQRVGKSSIELRGDRVTVSSRLLSRFRAAVRDWRHGSSRSSDVQFGLLLSGEKLIDNEDCRDELLQVVPEAVGGEMEAAGVYAGARETETPWIMVKAVCDWADGNKVKNKKRRQSGAAQQAVDFALHTLSLGGFASEHATGLSDVPHAEAGTVHRLSNDEFDEHHAKTYDCFFVYNSETDTGFAFDLDEKLRERGLKPWIQDREIQPGRPWQEELERVIRDIPAFVVMIGGHGFGSWENMKLQAGLAQLVEREVPVIPVIIPEGRPALPPFLGTLEKVDMRYGIREDQIDRVYWGITGNRIEVDDRPDRESSEDSSKDRTISRLDSQHSSIPNIPGAKWDTRSLAPDFLPTLMDQSEAITYAAAEVRGSRDTWHLEDEYAVLDRYWQSRLEVAPLAHDRLSRLATRLIDDGIYPWPTDVLEEAGLTEELLECLTRSGIVITDDEGKVSIFHHRIRAWVIAYGLITATDEGVITIEKLVTQIKGCAAPSSPNRLKFGHVAMDVLWLLASSERIDHSITREILIALEEDQGPPPLLSTLGARIIPYISDRLRHVDDRKAVKYINEIIGQIIDPSLVQHALSLLRSADHHQQLAAIRILENQPTAQALPRLWEIYRSWWSAFHQQNVTTNHETGDDEPEIYRSKIQGAKNALLASARSAPDWLTVTLLETDGKLLAEVANWLPLMENGEGIWRRVKSHLFSSLKRHRESLAFCVEAFDDHEEIPWLIEHIRVADGDDDIGPRARRALYRVDPESCFELTPADVSTSYWWLRSWWLPWAQLERPAESEGYLLKLVEKHGVWKVVQLFRGRPNWIPLRIFEMLLDLLTKTLAGDLESQLNDSPSTGPFLNFISEIGRPDLLKSLWSRSGSDLESRLADWLIRQGPNDTGFSQGYPEDGYQVLATMAGEEIPRVAANFMERATSFRGRRSGIELGARRWDNRVVDLLARNACRAEADEVGGNRRYPWSQQDALKALTIVWHNKAIMDGLIRLGFDAPRELHQYFAGRHLAYEVVDRVARDIAEGSVRDPGSIITLGLGGREHLRLIHRLISESSASTAEDEDITLACLLALEALSDSSQATIDVFTMSLDSPRFGFVAWRALKQLLRVDMRIGEVFFSRVIAHQTSISAAIPLLYSELWQKKTALHLWENLTEEELLSELGDHLDRFACLDRADVRNIIRRVALPQQEDLSERRRPRGSLFAEATLQQPSAIRGLLLFDKKTAFDAAQFQLAFGPERWRPYYPSRLLEADEQRALSLLKDLLTRSKSLPLIRATGEALELTENIGHLCEWLNDSSPQLRQGACLASDGLSWTQILDDNLLKLCRDPVRSVQTSAVQALEALREEKWSQELLDLLRSEQDNSRRWAIVEAAVELRNPGVMGSTLHFWTQRLPDDLPYQLRRYVNVRFGERGKKLVKDLESATRYM